MLTQDCAILHDMTRRAPAETPRQRLGRLLAAERKSRGWSQDDLSVATRTDPTRTRSGVAKRTISDIETGKEIESRSADRVAAVLGWQPGSVGQVLAGGDPIHGDAPRPATMLRRALMAQITSASDAELALLAQLLNRAHHQ